MQVAYGGYVAFGSLATAAFVPLTPPAGLVAPTMVEDDDEPSGKKAKNGE